MMVIIRTSDPPPPPPLPLPISEDANEQTEQYKVLQVQFLSADYKCLFCAKRNEQQMDLDASNSNRGAVKARQIHPGGNSCMFICRYLSANDRDPDCYQDPDSDIDSDSDPDSKLLGMFIAKELGDRKSELDI